jgi:hypothetical protein
MNQINDWTDFIGLVCGIILFFVGMKEKNAFLKKMSLVVIVGNILLILGTQWARHALGDQWSGAW